MITIKLKIFLFCKILDLEQNKECIDFAMFFFCLRTRFCIEGLFESLTSSEMILIAHRM